MNYRISLTLKITIFSFLLSLLIKRLGPLYPIDANQVNILTGIIVFPVVISLLMIFKSWIQHFKF